MSRITSKNPGTGSPVVIRDATEQDLSRMASDMIRYLPDGLFPHLGNHFVRRWMKTFLTERFGIALVAVSDDEQPIGFLIGSTNQVRHIADVLANQKWGLLLSGLAALSIRPRVLLHFLGTRARPYARRLLGRTASPVSSDRVIPSPAVITSLVVLPDRRGEGIGVFLMDAFLKRATADHARLAELATAAGANGAGKFYEKHGWTCVEQRFSKDGMATSIYHRYFQ